jgi:hypothetical protein
MTPTRKRRVRPVRREPVQAPPRRKRRKPVDIDWKNELVKLFIFFFLAADLVLVYFVVRQCARPASVVMAEPVEEIPRGPLQVEVLNGCGATGVAHQFTDYLRTRKLDVVKTDNYESFNVLKTVVIDRRGSRENALRIAGELGLPDDRVLQEINEAYLIDATIIIGKDFRQLAGWRREN